MKQGPWLVSMGVVWACVAVGCASRQPHANKPKQSDIDLASAFDGPPDRQLTGNHLFVQHLDVYELTLPLGGVSRNDEFWKRVDENAIDIAAYDLLQKNGFRVGVAPASEWRSFSQLLGQYPAMTQKTTVTAGVMGSLDLLMKKGIEFQNLFYLTDDNTLMGRTYEKCDNYLTVSFQPAPRKPGQVRVTMCPMVRSRRGHFQLSVRNEESEYEFVRPERLYDLNLCCDVPADGFLVVAPSLMAKWSCNLGSAFLVDEGATEKYEHVLIMVPRQPLVEQRPAMPKQH